MSDRKSSKKIGLLLVSLIDFVPGSHDSASFAVEVSGDSLATAGYCDFWKKSYLSNFSMRSNVRSNSLQCFSKVSLASCVGAMDITVLILSPEATFSFSFCEGRFCFLLPSSFVFPDTSVDFRCFGFALCFISAFGLDSVFFFEAEDSSVYLKFAVRFLLRECLSLITFLIFPSSPSFLPRSHLDPTRTKSPSRKIREGGEHPSESFFFFGRAPSFLVDAKRSPDNGRCLLGIGFLLQEDMYVGLITKC
mmetsp:Transcript_15253/g.34175  ORF Transcript_15253/g.34175 Transcript_15253/m.34175 type:complete len:249 (-) Transcript_15253:144-890(-)